MSAINRSNNVINIHTTKCEEIDSRHIRFKLYNLEVTLFHTSKVERDDVRCYYVPPVDNGYDMTLMRNTMFALASLPEAIVGTSAHFGYEGFLQWMYIRMSGCYVINRDL